MGYRIKLRKKDGSPMDKRQWLCFRDIDGGGYTRSTEKYATVFDTKNEIYSRDIQKYLEIIGCDFSIETVQ